MPTKTKVTKKKPHKRAIVSMPKDLTQRTDAQREHCIEYLMTLPLRELRIRQGITREQMKVAYNNGKSLDNLIERENDLYEAIDRQQFPSRRIVRNRSSGGMVAYDVYYNGKNIDTVFYNKYAEGGAPLDARYVKESLVNHDGYPPNIVVRRA